VSPTDTPTPPTATPPPEPTLAPAGLPASDVLEIGDPERGREIFESGGGVLSSSYCVKCHSLDGSVIDIPYAGPSLQGIYGRAGERVAGLSADEYVRQSIVDPAAYVVDGFQNLMPDSYQLVLSEEDIDALVAFMLTQ
jgi:cytochrome c oxidase subunit 2